MDVIVGIVASALATWGFAWYYFKRAGDELRAEAKRLHAATGAIVYMLEHPDAEVTAQRDEQGRVTGLVVHIRGSASLTISAKAELTATGVVTPSADSEK